MKLSEFVSDLYNVMESELEELTNASSNSFQQAKDCTTIILKSIAKLKEFISPYHFKNDKEEIFFFKLTKPQFLSKLLYYQNLFRIQFHKPLGPIGEIKMYYDVELSNLNKYFNYNNEFYLYYKSKADYLDEIYFVRKEPDSWLLLEFEDYQTDLNFTTIYDYKVSKFMAFELLIQFIEKQLNQLADHLNSSLSKDTSQKIDVQWTASKVSLVELLYALQSSGTCNNGTINLKNLAIHMEKLFHVDLGNYYRTFQEMRIRKINRTLFLDHLKENLIQKMDESDENPKFRL